MNVDGYDVALIFPRFRYPSGDPPLGVAYLAASLREVPGVSVTILDLTFERNPLSVVKGVFTKKRYHLAGISMMTPMYGDGAAVARIIREISPGTAIIAGGPHPTVLLEEVIRDGVWDMVCAGEGELAMRELLEKGLASQHVAGIWRRWDEGRINRGEPARPVMDLDALPFPALDLLPMERYLRAWYQLDIISPSIKGTSVLASRGCPFSCAFCQPTLNSIFGKKVRFRSPERVADELEELKERYGIGGVMFVDDTFGLNRSWTLEICREMIERRLNLLWGCNFRADLVDGDLVAAMKEAGLRKVFLGIESGSDRVLRETYRKGITVEQTRQAVGAFRSKGLYVQGYFIMGAPEEGEDEIEQTVRLARSLDIDDATFNICTPLPMTLLYDATRAKIGRPWQDFDYYKRSVYDHPSVLSHKKLARKRRGAIMRFYLGRKRIGATMRRSLHPSGFRKTMLKLKRF